MIVRNFASSVLALLANHHVNSFNVNVGSRPSTFSSRAKNARPLFNTGSDYDTWIKSYEEQLKNSQKGLQDYEAQLKAQTVGSAANIAPVENVIPPPSPEPIAAVPPPPPVNTAVDDETARIRSIYIRWCQKFGKDPRDEQRFQIFRRHFSEMADYAEMNQVPMTLTQFADMTFDEYMTATSNEPTPSAPTQEDASYYFKPVKLNLPMPKVELVIPGIPAPRSISYGEESRKFRRTVYTHDDWVRHRSSDRFVRNVVSILTSGIYKNIAKEVWFVVLSAAAIILWNAITGDFQDLASVSHPGLLKNTLIPVLTLPLTPFTLSSASLGLLLVFRTNAGYQRWDEARKNWGMNINHTRDLVRMGTAFYDIQGVSEEKRKQDLNELALATWSFVRAMKRHLSPESEDEEIFKLELYEKLPREQAQKIIDAAHRPNRALYDLSIAIENLPMHWLRKNEVHKAVTIFEDNLGSSERLLTSPVPIFYSRHTARFIFFWLLFLPFALYDSFGYSWNHIIMLPAIALLSLFLFGIEELANQMEEPFTILPMQAFCDKIYNWCMEIVSWEAGDNGMAIYSPMLNKNLSGPSPSGELK